MSLEVRFVLDAHGQVDDRLGGQGGHFGEPDVPHLPFGVAEGGEIGRC